MLRIFIVFFLIASPVCALTIDPLPSWKECETKKKILDFVRTVTDKKSKHYVRPSQRVAVFDCDGTILCEKPLYTQFVFARDRVKLLVDKNPELKKNKIFQAAIEGDRKTLAKSGSKGIQVLLGDTHAGLTTEQYEKIVADWMNSAKHPRYKKAYKKCVYQPMKEIIAFLQVNGFKTYIVTGSGRDFMRAWCKQELGIPPNQIVGSSCKLKFEIKDGTPQVCRTKIIDELNDGPVKPVGIQTMIGLKPIVAFGNSDGDVAMLQWTSSNKGKTLCAIVHHTDDVREYSYDKVSHVGHLEKGLELADKNGWQLIDMKNDWKTIFSFDQ